jgi:hypothetical protein
MTSEDTKSQRGGTGLAFRLILSSFAALFGATMLLIAPGAEKPAAHYLFGDFCLSIAAVCFTRGRVQRFIGSVIALIVVGITVWYLVAELTSGPIISGSSAVSSVLNAVLALLVFGLPAAAYLRKARFGFGTQPWTEPETIQIDDVGVLRVNGSIREQIRWADVEEIRIITTDGGPLSEDVFFALVDGEKKGCLIPHDAAVRDKLLEQLQSRFTGLDDEAIIRAMGSTSNGNFLIWRKSHSATDLGGKT